MGNWLLDILQVIAVLIVVVVIFFLAWYIPHVIAKKGSFGAKGRNIAILEKIPVSKESYIMLLKTFDKVILVGVTPGGMTTLREIEDGEYQPEDIASSQQGFSQALKDAIAGSIPEGKIKDTFDKFINRKKGGDGNEE